MSVAELDCLRHPPEAIVTFVRQLIKANRNTPEAERRSNPREVVTLPITAQPLDENFRPVGDCFSAVTKDISTGGVGILHTEVVAACYLQIRFDEQDDQQMTLLAHVRHCTTCGNMFHIGARFVVDWSHWQSKSLQS